MGIVDSEEITFFVIGDHGGVKDPGPQNAVSDAMQKRAEKEPSPAFVYTVGDVVYFNGEEAKYASQFYEPYAHLQLPIVGVPGNHDGDTSDDPSRQPLDAFMANFCASAPAMAAGMSEYGRDVQTQPYCDWTLALESVTIVGLYTNVPPGGHLEPAQVDWLTGELKNANSDRPVIVTLHHPPYSVDQMHGGSARMGAALDNAFAAAGRIPELVLSGHVHDYQRFTRRLADSQELTYVVIGNSGYHNLHHLTKDAKPGMQPKDGVVFEYGDGTHWGYLELTVSTRAIRATYTSVAKDGTTKEDVDRFTVARRSANAPGYP